jgi:glycine betaine/proline transport system substrate-binding protein
MNPNQAYDCGKPRGWIKAVGWKDGAKKWPCAYKAVQDFTISNQEMGEMVGLVDLDGKKVDDVVEDWIKANKAKWSQWTQCK